MDRLLQLDSRLSQRLFIADTPGVLRSMAGLLAHSGDSWFWGAGLVAAYFLVDSPWRERTILLFLAIGALAALILLIKLLVRRRRPEGTWGTIYRKSDPHSFPSGHAARATMLAILLASWGPAWFGPLFGLWALLVTLSRVAMGLHYLSDVAVGVVMGALAAAAVLQIPTLSALIFP